jgi:hypothetical protein
MIMRRTVEDLPPVVIGPTEPPSGGGVRWIYTLESKVQWTLPRIGPEHDFKDMFDGEILRRRLHMPPEIAGRPWRSASGPTTPMTPGWRSPRSSGPSGPARPGGIAAGHSSDEGEWAARPPRMVSASPIPSRRRLTRNMAAPKGDDAEAATDEAAPRLTGLW